MNANRPGSALVERNVEIKIRHYLPGKCDKIEVSAHDMKLMGDGRYSVVINGIPYYEEAVGRGIFESLTCDRKHALSSSAREACNIGHFMAIHPENEDEKQYVLQCAWLSLQGHPYASSILHDAVMQM